MPTRGAKIKALSKKYGILKTSWLVQGKLFFEHSTLHGVRYIAETGRPFIERFMWFACVSIGTVATSVIIFNLWQKFQTNPTITGLDTDFHNWEVPFPGITVCQQVPVSQEKIEAYLQEKSGRNETSIEAIQFLTNLAKLSYKTWDDFYRNYSEQNYILPDEDLKKVVFDLVYKCEDIFEECHWKSYYYNCCEGFFPVFTENGFCYTFNSRLYERTIPGEEKPLPEFNIRYIQETDIEWSMRFNVKIKNSEYSIYILNSDEVAGIDTQPQHIWDFRMEVIMFSVKQTYTTLDTKQLSIKQRHCAFPGEIKLKTEYYSYTACTRECRMNKALKLCKCVPFFYPSYDGVYPHCRISQFSCIADHINDIKSVDGCSCYLGCSNTVYELEKLDSAENIEDNNALNCKFVSWPMVRYKREVLFGWVDLLVSFGGIAGLFLGFSLLSGVEIIYYFTVRASCMVLREKEELQKIQRQEASKPLPEYDLSLVPYFISKPLPGNGINEIAKKFENGGFAKITQKITSNYKPGQLRNPKEFIISPFGIEYVN